MERDVLVGKSQYQNSGGAEIISDLKPIFKTPGTAKDREKLRSLGGGLAFKTT